MIELGDYGFIPTLDTFTDDVIVARVTAVHKERYELICQYGLVFGRLKSGIYYNDQYEAVWPTTGDFVTIQYNGSGDSIITKTLERKSFFSRLDPIPGKGMQAVAANFDYVFILTSLNQDFNMKRLERYLTLSWQSGGVPVVILTKADLEDDHSEYVKAIEKYVKNVGVYAVSAKTGYGLDELSDYIKPRKTIVFLGSSGVGKSSLLNALAKEEIMKVNEIREDDARGRHTTTHRQLIMLPNGSMIIDTPGMREIGMFDVSKGLGEAFLDVEDFFGMCKFKDCKHGNEPGCAIKKALQNGELSRERWDSYLQLKKEARFSDDKANYMREKQQWHKSIAKTNKNNEKKKEFY